MEYSQITTLLAVLVPIVAVPLSAITFFLSALRSQQRGSIADMNRRLARLEQRTDMLQSRQDQVDRDAVYKEDWLRESATARAQRQRLAQAIIRLNQRVRST